MFNKTKPDDCQIYVTREQLLKLRFEKPKPLARQSYLNNTQLVGELMSSLKGNGLEFTDIRPYQPGDEVRHIDWRTTARTGKPYTREYIEERQQAVYLSIDQRINMFFGSGCEFKSVASAKVASLVAWACVARSFHLGGTVIGDASEQKSASIQQSSTIRSGPARQTSLKLIDVLAVANNSLSANQTASQNASTSLNLLLNQTLAHTQTGAIVYVISDFQGFNTESNATLTALGRKCRIVMLRIADMLEETLSVSGTVGISNGKEKKNFQVTNQRRDRYIKQHQEFLNDLQHCADASGASLLHQLGSERDGNRKSVNSNTKKLLNEGL